MRIPCATLMLCLLSVCAACAPADQPAVAPPPSLLAPCDPPVALPDRAISDQEAEIWWGRDRSALRACASRHQGLVGAVRRPAIPPAGTRRETSPRPARQSD